MDRHVALLLVFVSASLIASSVAQVPDDGSAVPIATSANIAFTNNNLTLTSTASGYGNVGFTSSMLIEGNATHAYGVRFQVPSAGNQLAIGLSSASSDYSLSSADFQLRIDASGNVAVEYKGTSALLTPWKSMPTNTDVDLVYFNSTVQFWIGTARYFKFNQVPTLPLRIVGTWDANSAPVTMSVINRIASLETDVADAVPINWDSSYGIVTVNNGNEIWGVLANSLCSLNRTLQTYSDGTVSSFSWKNSANGGNQGGNYRFEIGVSTIVGSHTAAVDTWDASLRLTGKHGTQHWGYTYAYNGATSDTVLMSTSRYTEGTKWEYVFDNGYLLLENNDNLETFFESFYQPGTQLVVNIKLVTAGTRMLQVRVGDIPGASLLEQPRADALDIFYNRTKYIQLTANRTTIASGGDSFKAGFVANDIFDASTSSGRAVGLRFSDVNSLDPVSFGFHNASLPVSYPYVAAEWDYLLLCNTPHSSVFPCTAYEKGVSIPHLSGNYPNEVNNWEFTIRDGYVWILQSSVPEKAGKFPTPATGTYKVGMISGSGAGTLATQIRKVDEATNPPAANTLTAAPDAVNSAMLNPLVNNTALAGIAGTNYFRHAYAIPRDPTRVYGVTWKANRGSSQDWYVGLSPNPDPSLDETIDAWDINVKADINYSNSLLRMYARTNATVVSDYFDQPNSQEYTYSFKVFGNAVRWEAQGNMEYQWATGTAPEGPLYLRMGILGYSIYDVFLINDTFTPQHVDPLAIVPDEFTGIHGSFTPSENVTKFVSSFARGADGDYAASPYAIHRDDTREVGLTFQDLPGTHNAASIQGGFANDSAVGASKWLYQVSCDVNYANNHVRCKFLQGLDEEVVGSTGVVALYPNQQSELRMIARGDEVWVETNYGRVFTFPAAAQYPMYPRVGAKGRYFGWQGVRRVNRTYTPPTALSNGLTYDLKQTLNAQVFVETGTITLAREILNEAGYVRPLNVLQPGNRKRVGVSFSVNPTAGDLWAIGLTNSSTPGDTKESWQFWMGMLVNNQISVGYEATTHVSGTTITAPNAETHTFQLLVEGSTVKVYKDDAVVYTFAEKATTAPLVIRFYTLGSTGNQPGTPTQPPALVTNLRYVDEIAHVMIVKTPSVTLPWLGSTNVSDIALLNEDSTAGVLRLVVESNTTQVTVLSQNVYEQTGSVEVTGERSVISAALASLYVSASAGATGSETLTLTLYPQGQTGNNYVDQVSVNVVRSAEPAATITFTAGTSTSWNDASNWTPNRLPNDADVVAVSNTVVVDTPTATARVLKATGTANVTVVAGALLSVVDSGLVEAGARVTVGSGGALRALGTVHVLGTLVLDANSKVEGVSSAAAGGHSLRVPGTMHVRGNGGLSGAAAVEKEYVRVGTLVVDTGAGLNVSSGAVVSVSQVAQLMAGAVLGEQGTVRMEAGSQINVGSQVQIVQGTLQAMATATVNMSHVVCSEGALVHFDGPVTVATAVNNSVVVGHGSGSLCTVRLGNNSQVSVTLNGAGNEELVLQSDVETQKGGMLQVMGSSGGMVRVWRNWNNAASTSNVGMRLWHANARVHWYAGNLQHGLDCRYGRFSNHYDAAVGGQGATLGTVTVADGCVMDMHAGAQRTGQAVYVRGGNINTEAGSVLTLATDVIVSAGAIQNAGIVQPGRSFSTGTTDPLPTNYPQVPGG